MTNKKHNQIPSLLAIAIIYLNAEFADINTAYADNQLTEKQPSEDNVAIADEHPVNGLREKETVPENAGINEQHEDKDHDKA